MTKDDGRVGVLDAMSDSELLKLVIPKLSLPDLLRGRSVASEAQTASARRDALEELLRRHYAWILRMSQFELAGANAAFDCAQEALVEIAKGIDRFDGRSELRTWIFVIVRRTIWRYRKVERLQRERSSDLQQADWRGTAQEASAESQLILSEQKRRLLSHVRELPEMQRHSVLLHYFEDLSVEDTAKRLGCSEGTVKTHLFRARAQLKKLLGELE